MMKHGGCLDGHFDEDLIDVETDKPENDAASF